MKFWRPQTFFSQIWGGGLILLIMLIINMTAFLLLTTMDVGLKRLSGAPELLAA